MRKIFFFLLLVATIGVEAQIIIGNNIVEDYYFLYRLEGIDVPVDEISNVADKYLLVAGHKNRFNYFYVFELKTFQLVFGKSIPKTEKFDGSLSYAYEKDSIIYFPKETFANTYFAIDLSRDTIQNFYCDQTPKMCPFIERKVPVKVCFGKDLFFVYERQKRDKKKVFIRVSKAYLRELKKQKEIDNKTAKEYLLSGKR